jgi:hypothetical protein
MSDDPLPRNLFPAWYCTPIIPTTYAEIVISNWLDVEIDERAAEVMPVLKEVAGHRRREVISYCEAHQQWINELVLDMYGEPGRLR